MSASGILFVTFTALAFASAGTGKWVLAFFLVVCGVMSMAVAVYHDDERDKRIAELEKKLSERNDGE